FRPLFRYRYPAAGTKRREFIYVDAPSANFTPAFLRFRGTAAPKSLPVSTLTKAEVSRTLAFTMSYKEGNDYLHERNGSFSYQQALTMSANDAGFDLNYSEDLVRNYLIQRKIVSPP